MNNLQFFVFVPLAGVCFLIGAGLKAIGNETLDTATAISGPMNVSNC